MKTEKWLDYAWYTEWCPENGNKPKPWLAFMRDWRSDIKRMLKDTEWELFSAHDMFFCASAFLYNEKADKWIYLSISDVRHWNNEWYEHMLIRTARGNKDYTGGTNHYCRLTNLVPALDVSHIWW